MSDVTLFSKVEADRILKRAAEIEGSDDAGPVTVDELRSIASEAGFGAQAIDRAIAEARRAEAASAHRHEAQKRGLVFRHFSTSRSVPVEIDSEQLMRAVRLFQPYRDGPAHVNLGVNGITWRDRKGLRFAVSSSGGVTEIKVEVSRILIRRRRWMAWLHSAADRLETLILLMASRDPAHSRTHQLSAAEPSTAAFAR